MSRRPEVYGSSSRHPGESRFQLHGGANLYTPFSTGTNYVYSGAVGSFPPQVNTAEQVYVAQAATSGDYNYLVGGQPFHYGQPFDEYYHGGQPLYFSRDGYAVPQMMHTNQYSGWSFPEFLPRNNVTSVDPEVHDAAVPVPDPRPLNGDSNSKSRRFSRRRNVKEGESGRSRALQGSALQYNNLSKSEIRFSHQRREADETAGSPHTSEKQTDSSKRQSKIELKQDKKPASSSDHQLASNSVNKHSAPKKKKDRRNYGSSETQLGVLIDQLTSGSYECMVCCDRVKQQHAIWNCEKCYHVFHMICIKKWARSPAAHADEEGWRCPGCQNINKKFPNVYKCFCGKVKEPEWNRRETPHSCGEVCGKKRSHNASCTHPCNILCHPGPCPPCPASVIKPCLCGKISEKVRCSQQKPLTCTDECGKPKNCGIHKCEVICHSGECNDCSVLVEQACFCGKNKREVLCGSKESKLVSDAVGNNVYSCGIVCEKKLSCGSHLCEEICHPGECADCPLTPINLKTCPCTQTKISDITDEHGNKYERRLCTDPIPTCGKICGKPLKCGGDSVHTCQLRCHVGACPPCTTNTSTVHCRCGKSENDVPCAEIPDEPYICDRRCNKKRKCGRHKCGKTCCTDEEHNCMQICGRKLECKLHRCEELCHRGNCHSCYNVSFDELCCHCGAEVLYPPIPCGTKPPECLRQCIRHHACYHPVNHNCHNEDKCPPCVVLVKKQCNCGKVIRSNIPCYQTNVSCGAPCKKVLPCGHNCLKLCHPGSCQEEDGSCTQPCSIMRVECIHPCAMPCHQGKACPSSKCKAMVTLKCVCGNRQMQVECSESSAILQRLSSESLARQHNAKESVDISGIFQASSGRQKILPCNDQCATIERNRRLAEALDIADDNDAEPEQQLYSPFLLSWAKKDPVFVQGVEQELVNLIDAIAWLDQSKRSFPFPSMRREKRQVIHELAEVMHCKSVSVDEEPNRNVVVTAARGISRIPRILLGDIAKKKAPAPGFVRSAVPDSKQESSTDNPKRLLSSMKLVSMTSPPTPTSTKQVAVSQPRRPASIPKMPSHHLPSVNKGPLFGGNLPSLGRVSASSSIRTSQSTSYAAVEKAASSDSSLDQRRNPEDRSAARTFGQKSEKEDPEIDYFDMIG